MVAAKCQLYGVRPLEKESVFDIYIAENEVAGGWCQLQLEVARRRGFGSYTIEWGDGNRNETGASKIYHNYVKSGIYTVKIGEGARWWRLLSAYTCASDGRSWTSKPKIIPKCWSDYLESAQGTYCGWNDPVHGGVQGGIIEWGRSITTTLGCYQGAEGVTGGIPPWPELVTNVAATYDGAGGLSGDIPKWGREIVTLNQTFSGCAGLNATVKAWPEKAVELSACFRGVKNLRGAVPAWTKGAGRLNSVFEGCTSLTGVLPEWPEGVKDLSRCFHGCTGLEGAWTDDPALLMPEAKLGDDWFYTDVVTGASEAVRSLFYAEGWGGTREREQ